MGRSMWRAGYFLPGKQHVTSWLIPKWEAACDELATPYLGSSMWRAGYFLPGKQHVTSWLFPKWEAACDELATSYPGSSMWRAGYVLPGKQHVNGWSLVLPVPGKQHVTSWLLPKWEAACDELATSYLGRSKERAGHYSCLGRSKERAGHYSYLGSCMWRAGCFVFSMKRRAGSLSKKHNLSIFCVTGHYKYVVLMVLAQEKQTRNYVMIDKYSRVYTVKTPFCNLISTTIYDKLFYSVSYIYLPATVLATTILNLAELLIRNYSIRSFTKIFFKLEKFVLIFGKTY
jgi:hypothetical protein